MLSEVQIEQIRQELDRRRGLLEIRLQRLEDKAHDKRRSPRKVSSSTTASGTKISTRVSGAKAKRAKKDVSVGKLQKQMARSAKALGISAEQLRQLGLADAGEQK